jgi:glycerol uptake facilitator protein
MTRQMDSWLAEVVGTFLLVFIGGGAGVLAPSGTGTLIPALAHGLALFIIVSVVGGISGAHVNPAVTLALASIGKFSWLRVPGYLVAQFVGAGLGALAVAGIYGTEKSVAPTLNQGVSLGTGLLAEALGAGILVLAVVAAAADTRRSFPNGFAGLVIGLALASAIFVVWPITRAGVNPALALSPYAVDAFFHHMPPLGVNQIAAYLAGPIVGGVVAAFLYSFMAHMPIARRAPARQPAKQPVKQPASARKR